MANPHPTTISKNRQQAMVNMGWSKDEALRLEVLAWKGRLLAIEDCLNDFQGRLRDMRGAWPDTQKIIVDIVQRNFYHQGRPGWKERKDTRHDGWWPILRKTGDLMRAARYPVSDSNPLSLNLRANVGAVGMAHQYGVRSKSSVRSYTRRGASGLTHTVNTYSRFMRLAARPFFVMNRFEWDVPTIRTSVMSWIVEPLFKAAAIRNGGSMGGSGQI